LEKLGKRIDVLGEIYGVNTKRIDEWYNIGL